MNMLLLDFRNLSLKLLTLFLSAACSSGELWLVRATGLIKPTKKPRWTENERLCHFGWICWGKAVHTRSGDAFIFTSELLPHLWGAYSHFIWSWDREELQFTAKVFRTPACLAHLFASSLEPQCGQGGIQLWNQGWENKNAKFCWYSEVNCVPQIVSAGWCS